MTDIIDRLLEKRQINEIRKHRDFDVNGQINSVYREELFNPDGLEAADTIEALRAENARLREALKGVLSGVGGAVSAPTDVQMISVGALELDDEDD